MILFVYTADGERVNSLAHSVRIAAPFDDLKHLLAQGLIFHEELSAPAKGDYFFRVAVHELHRDRYGAVEVATAQVKNLVGLTAPVMHAAPVAAN